MLKRLQDLLPDSEVSQEERHYQPTEEELELEKMAQIGGGKAEDYAFEGLHKCILCPEKVISSDKALEVHLNSKAHQKRLDQFMAKKR